MKEIEEKIEELQTLIFIYNQENKTRIEEITIYVDYSKILTGKTNFIDI